jgi:hypothetical protein
VIPVLPTVGTMFVFVTDLPRRMLRRSNPIKKLRTAIRTFGEKVYLVGEIRFPPFLSLNPSLVGEKKTIHSHSNILFHFEKKFAQNIFV